MITKTYMCTHTSTFKIEAVVRLPHRWTTRQPFGMIFCWLSLGNGHENVPLWPLFSGICLIIISAYPSVDNGQFAQVVHHLAVPSQWLRVSFLGGDHGYLWKLILVHGLPKSFVRHWLSYVEIYVALSQFSLLHSIPWDLTCILPLQPFQLSPSSL